MNPFADPPVVCDCGDIPPTMPTCRSEHLADCPITTYRALHDVEGVKATAAEAGRIFATGDKDALAAFLSRDVKARAHAAFLRSRGMGA